MTTLYHSSPTLLGPGSIILPGNWGRILSLLGAKHPSWAREKALEAHRQKAFPEKPSRLESCFACPTEAAARRYQHRPGTVTDVLYEVEKIQPEAIEHLADFNVVEPLPLPGFPAEMEGVAELYWTATFWTTVAEWPGVRCEEVVTPSPLRILKRIG